MAALVPDFEFHKAEVIRLACEEGWSNSQIGAKLGFHPSTIHAWIQRPEYQASIKHWYSMLEDEVLRLSAATKANRLKDYQDMLDRIHMVVKGRSESLSHVPGGESGLLVKQVKTVGTGPNAYDVAEYLFDAALVKEWRAANQQMAQERGQWSEKSEQKISVTEKITVIRFQEQSRRNDDAIEADFAEIEE